MLAQGDEGNQGRSGRAVGSKAWSAEFAECVKLGQVSMRNWWDLLGVSKGSSRAQRNEKREGRGRKKGKQVRKEGEKDKEKVKR